MSRLSDLQAYLPRARPAPRPLVLGGVLAAATFACSPTSHALAEKTQADIAIMRREQSADKLLDRGKGFASIGDMTRAEEYLSAALDAGASPKEVLPLLMTVCVQSGRYRSAIQHAENHLRKHPDDVRTRFVLGTLYAAIGDNKGAHDALIAVVATRPDDPRAHYALAVLARDAENDVVEADAHFREYLRIEPNGAHAEEAKDALLKRVP